MKKHLLVAFFTLSAFSAFSQIDIHYFDSLNVLFDKYANQNEMFSIVNSIEYTTDSIRISSTIFVKSVDQSAGVKTIYNYFPSDIQGIYSGKAPAKNWVIYLSTKGNKIRSCTFDSNGNLKDCKREKTQNLILGKMSNREIKVIEEALISSFNQLGGKIKTK